MTIRINFIKNSPALGCLVILNQKGHVSFMTPRKLEFQDYLEVVFMNLPMGMYSIVVFDIESNGLPTVNATQAVNSTLMLYEGSTFEKGLLLE